MSLTNEKNRVPDYKVDVWWRVFKMFDTDESGSLDINEVGNAMRAAGLNPTEKRITELIQSVDKNNDGDLGFDEFVEFMQLAENDSAPDFDELKLAFNIIDADGNGKLSEEELIQALVGTGETFTVGDVKAMMSFDSDNDGLLDINEFIESMRKYQQPESWMEQQTAY